MADECKKVQERCEHHAGSLDAILFSRLGKQQIKNIRSYGSANHDNGKQGAWSLPRPSGEEPFLSQFFVDDAIGPLQVCKYAGITTILLPLKV